MDNQIKQHPAQLWLGENNKLIIHTEKFLRDLWCKNKNCGYCFICKAISEHQHHLLLWIKPEKHFYSVDQIEEIQHKTAFELNQDEDFYIVFEQAEALSINSCNKLLKIVEEPPRGYHFIFLAPSMENILPTLISRCILTNFKNENFFEIRYINFAEKILDTKTSLFDLQKEIESLNPNEYETNRILTIIFENLMRAYKDQIDKKENEALRTFKILEIIKSSLKQTPMPGSAKIFWRNILLQISTVSRIS